MDKILDKLLELQSSLQHMSGYDAKLLLEAKGKVELYIDKFFKHNTEFYKSLEAVRIDSIQDTTSFMLAKDKLESLISTLIEDIELNKLFTNEDEINLEKKIKEKLKDERIELDKRKAVIDNELKNLQLNKERVDRERLELINQNEEFKKLQEDLKNERERLIVESKKFNEFKTKLEFAGKRIDFQILAKSNRNIAYIWATLSIILIFVFIISLSKNLSQVDSFTNIIKSINESLQKTSNITQELTKQNLSIIIYFTFFKYSITRLLLYSIFIYAIVFCVKNYNAQMHNHVVNTHRSNALRSTLSLLDTARSDDGNDKLLLQATLAIFAHQNSGYNGHDNEPTNPNLITNVIESVSKKI